MSKRLTIDDARQSLNAHAAEKAQQIREKHGPRIGWTQLLRILNDPECVRYPCEIVFDAAPLHEGEFAYPVAKGEHPEDGFTLHVHPYFASQPERVPYLALYQLVLVNYGEFASADDAETFGAGVFGISKNEYYRILCAMADEIASVSMPDELSSCGCHLS